jgi:aspartyl-tRNA(Asn)/glutamyl-tRNA(Gln) amidotransferase subunit A
VKARAALRDLGAAIALGEKTCEEAVAEAFRAIDDPARQGKVAFIELARDKTFEKARAWDRIRRAGSILPPLAGIPFSVKDNIAIAGMKTRAGSRVLATAPAETFDALVVRDLRALGAICVGKTNMTEFAYSALGNKAHFGTPLSNRETGQIAGGSSSGAAVSVAEGMVGFAVGTDTSGSCRIPAAFCGIAGFRPTAGRYPRDNTIPLAPTFDSVGALAASCADLAFLDGLLAPPGHPIPKAHGTGLLVPDEAFDDIDPDVAHAFEGVVAQLREAGTPIRRASIPVIAETRALVGSAKIVGFEAYSWHRDLFAAHADRYDPRVAIRLATGGSLSASTYAYGLRRLADLRKESTEPLARQPACFCRPFRSPRLTWTS